MRIEHVEGRWGTCYYLPKDEYVGKSIWNYGEYNKDETEYILALAGLKKGRVLDIGANIGSIAQALHKEGFEVECFEPQPAMFKLLELNCPDTKNHNVALGRFPGIAVMPKVNYDRKGNFGGLGIGGMIGISVEVKTLDEYGYDDISLIKLDVEGYEEEVLKGAVETIKRCKPIIYLEADREEKLYSLSATLKTLGYSYSKHNPPLFSKDNFFKNPRDIWGRKYVSLNWDCRPND